MRVSQVQYRIYTQNTYNKPSFNGWERQVLKDASAENPFITEISHRNNTSAFRDGRQIPDIIDDTVYWFRDEPYINTYIYGCSNGAEPYSMLIYTDSKYGFNTLSKFLPFRAKDFDLEAIMRAKRNVLPIEPSEFWRIYQYTGGNFNKYFDGKRLGLPLVLDKNNDDDILRIFKMFNKTKMIEYGVVEGREVRLKDKYANLINYDLANILDDYKTIRLDEPSFVCARNFWPYLGANNIRKLAKNLGTQMREGSVLVVGSYDVGWLNDSARKNPLDLIKLLRENGFEKFGKSGCTLVKVR